MWHSDERKLLFHFSYPYCIVPHHFSAPVLELSHDPGILLVKSVCSTVGVRWFGRVRMACELLALLKLIIFGAPDHLLFITGCLVDHHFSAHCRSNNQWAYHNVSHSIVLVNAHVAAMLDA